MARYSKRKIYRLKNLAKMRLNKAQNVSELVTKRDTDQALTINHKGPKIKSTEEKPYKCDVCEKPLNHENHKSHKIKPTGDKPYKCDVCEKMPRRKRRSFFQAQKRLLQAQDFSEFVTNRDTNQTLTMNHKGDMIKPYKRDVCERKPRGRRRSFFQAKKQLLLLQAQESSEFVTNRDTDQALTMNHKSHKIKPTRKKPYKRNVCEKSMNHKSHEKRATDEKPYKHDVCNKSMNHESHKMKPTGEKPYKRDVCEKSRNHKSHKMKPTGEKPHKRDDCNKSRNHKSHKIKPTEMKPLNCGICGLSFDMTRKLGNHMKIHKTEKPYECDVCEKSFTCPGTLKIHMRKIHTGRKPLKCDVCAKFFFTAQQFREHMRTHTEEIPFKCDVCENSFFTLYLYKVHMKKQHTGENPFHCGICGLGFDMTSKLGTHIAIHKTEKTYECDVCGKRSSKLLYHTEHMRVHTREKPFKCNICGEGFIKPNAYKVHKKQHTGENSLNCGICGLGFDMTSKLGSHVKIHKTEKPYECDVCGKCFITASAFEVHKKTQCYSVSTSDQPAMRTSIILSLYMKHKIICDNEKEPRPALKDLATKYGTSCTTIGNILKRKDEIMQMFANKNNANRKRLVSKHSKCEQVNKMTYDWFVSARSKKVPMSGPFIKTKALMFADKMKIVDFKATQSWLVYWKSCYNIKDFKGT